MGIGMEQNLDFSSYNKIKRASNEELMELWRLYFEDHENKNLRDQLILQYIYLTRYVVGRVKVALPPTFTYEDISSYGIEGLIDAVEKYTPKMGARFETYALVRIRGNIIDKVRSQDFLPRSIRRKIKDVKVAQDELKKQFGRSATNTEIANYLGIEKEKVEQSRGRSGCHIGHSGYPGQKTGRDHVVEKVIDNTGNEHIKKLVHRHDHPENSDRYCCRSHLKPVIYQI